MSGFFKKIATSLLRAWQAAAFFPLRAARLGSHVFDGFTGKFSRRSPVLPAPLPVQWWLELLFLLTDLLAVPEIYETLSDWLKWRTRPLTNQETELAKSVFGQSLDYRRIRIDEGAHVACRHHHLLYVSFFTINSWGSFRPDVFIHELVHVWQYQHLGAVYIPRALLAQRTAAGYNYGGADRLRAVGKLGGTLSSFNLEQQADIISDGFCLREGFLPRWTANCQSDFPIFERYLFEVGWEKPKPA